MGDRLASRARGEDQSGGLGPDREGRCVLRGRSRAQSGGKGKSARLLLARCVVGEDEGGRVAGKETGPAGGVALGREEARRSCGKGRSKAEREEKAVLTGIEDEEGCLPSAMPFRAPFRAAGGDIGREGRRRGGEAGGRDFPLRRLEQHLSRFASKERGKGGPCPLFHGVSLGPAVGADEPGEGAERGENFPVAFVVGFEFDTIGAGQGEGQFERVDRIEAEPFTEQGSVRIDVLGLVLEMQNLHDEAGDLRFESGLGRMGCVVHGPVFMAVTPSPYVKPPALLSSRAGQELEGGVSFTVDVEFDRPDGEGVRRSAALTLKLADFLEARGIRGTFFILDEVARRAPFLVRTLAERGHEIGSHGLAHVPLARLERALGSLSLRLAAARALLEDLAGAPVGGFRAPFFSLRPESAFVIEALLAAGFTYSSSVIPGPAWIGGWPGVPIQPFRWPGGLIEFPVPVVRLFGRHLPLLGGMYLRALPEWDFRRLYPRLAGQLLWTYCHPYEAEEGKGMRRLEGAGWLASLMLSLNRRAMLRRWEWLAAHPAPPLGERAERVRTLPCPLPLVPLAP
jgi:hypothetical protein